MHLPLVLHRSRSVTHFAGPADKRLDLYWIDVEGGAATLLVTPAGETVLIDTGNPGRRDADRIVKAVTEVAGMKQIDHLIITHYHGDHFGGALTLVEQLPIRNLYDNGQFEGMPDNPGKAYFELKVGQRHVVKPGNDAAAEAGRTAAAPKLSIHVPRRAKAVHRSAADAADNARHLRQQPREGTRRLGQRQQRGDGGRFRRLAVL